MLVLKHSRTCICKLIRNSRAKMYHCICLCGEHRLYILASLMQIYLPSPTLSPSLGWEVFIRYV